MNTTNLISTPNIEGNIGSCSVKTELVITYSGWMSDEGFTVLTNSCTGKVTQEPYHSLGLIPVGGSLLVGLLFCMVLFVVGLNILTN